MSQVYIKIQSILYILCAMRLRSSTVLALMLLGMNINIYAQSISIGGTVPVVFGVMPPTIPGDPPVETYETTMGDVTITPNGGNKWAFGDSWHVTVSKSDVTWDATMLLDVRREANTKLVGGTAYQQIPDSPTASYFFETTPKTKKVNNLGLQHRLRTTAPPPAGNYTTTIIYTIVDD